MGDFGDNKGIRRIWQALQLVQIVGIPVASLTASTVIASLAPPAGSPAPDAIAANFWNAVKSQYPNAAWLPIAKSVFDQIRRRKRDGLVAYLVQELDLENSKQLFEYFLVDPEMEPVVQTSRLRLAMSSLQTFVQRCLLNMENANRNPELNVSPSAIDADWWAWIKRYRVWQANREIFLYPENWMIPELRLDQTDLFQTLAGTLLQGDITADTVEDALVGYLKGLDAYARLDIVATYLDQNTVTPALSTLYVLACTHGSPRNYYFRTYFADVWSAWLPVTHGIEGDHVTLAVWRGRLHVLWVSFIGQPAPTSTSLGSGVSAGQVSALTFEQIGTVTSNARRGRGISFSCTGPSISKASGATRYPPSSRARRRSRSRTTSTPRPFVSASQRKQRRTAARGRWTSISISRRPPSPIGITFSLSISGGGTAKLPAFRSLCPSMSSA
jgi:hypothetical protein